MYANVNIEKNVEGSYREEVASANVKQFLINPVGSCKEKKGSTGTRYVGQNVRPHFNALWRISGLQYLEGNKTPLMMVQQVDGKIRRLCTYYGLGDFVEAPSLETKSIWKGRCIICNRALQNIE